MQQVMVFGTQVQVLVPAEPLGINGDIPVLLYIEALQSAGYAGESADAVFALLQGSGYDIPSAWLDAPRAELIEAGVASGRVNALQAAMHTMCIRLCGAPYARVFSGSERTDAEAAQQVLKAKHVPQAPVVTEATGWGPTGQAWREYMYRLVSWLGTVDKPLATSVSEVIRNFEVLPATLLVPRGSVRDLALGSVLRGADGVGQMTRLVGAEAMTSGSGLWLLQDITAIIMSPMEDVGFGAWQHPKPEVQAHLIEARVLGWTKDRGELRDRDRPAP